MPKYDRHYQMIDNYTQHMQAKHIANRVHEIQRKLKPGVAEGSSIMQGIRIQENATGGSMSAASVGAVVTGLGEMPNAIIKRQKAYTNQRTRGGTVKVKQ
jgi:hypothetical protein